MNGDHWDDGPVLDEDFVRGASHLERSGAERIAAAQRIAREHAKAAGWRADPASVPRGRTTTARSVLVAVLVVVLVAGFVGWQALRPPTLSNRPGASTALGRVFPTTSPSWPTTSRRHSLLPGPPPDAAHHPLGTPAAAPPGTGGYRFEQVSPNGKPVTFDPCEPLHYTVRRAGEPVFGESALAQGIAEVSRATGLRFVRDPDTTETPSAQRLGFGSGPDKPRWRPVLIAWSNEQESPELEGPVGGFGGPGGAYDDGTALPSMHYKSGQVVLDAPDLTRIAARPNEGFAQVRAVVLHELGHLVGLEHVDDRSQVMFASTTGIFDYAAGDLRGLHALGSGTCAATS